MNTISNHVADTALMPPDADWDVVEWVIPDGGDDPPQFQAPIHVHWDDDETWYVLAGRMSVLLNGERFDIPAGGAATAIKGTPHTYWNPDDFPCRYLLIMPKRIHRLIDALHKSDVDEAAIGGIFRHHHSEIVGGWAMPNA